MARKQIDVRPGKGTSGAGFIGGLVFCVIGMFVVIPLFGGFGVLWTLLAGVITLFHGMNLFSEKGIATHQVIIEDDDEKEAFKEEAFLAQDKTNAPKESAEQRLLQARRLYEDRLITGEEYEAKRKEILEEL